MRLLLTLTALLAASPALAQQSAAPPAQTRPAGPQQPQATIIYEPLAMMIAAFDTDRDARVTRAEYDSGLKASWDSIDTGKTGSLSYIGFSDWAFRWLGDRNALPNPFDVDRDGNNRVSFDELAARFDDFFRRFDADKNGVIVRSELVTLRNPVFDNGRRRKEKPQSQ